MNQSNFNLPLLPPPIELSSMLKLIVEAHRAVAEYDAVFGQMQNPNFLLNITQSNEAVLSSRIEGTQASLTDVLEHEISKKSKTGESAVNEIREIINYRRAIRQGEGLIKKGQTISESMIKHLHTTLLESVRGDQFKPGQYKTVVNWIGKPGSDITEAIYLPPGPDQTERLMANLINYLQIDDKQIASHLIQIAVGHYQFEAIHPFNDGNGRIGRLIIPLYLYEKGVTSKPNLYLSEFIAEHKEYYYNALNMVHHRNNWNQWLEFFLRGVRYQSRVLISRALKIEDLYRDIVDKIKTFNSIYAFDFTKALFQKPIFEVSDIQKQANIKSPKTTRNLIEKFRKQGYLEIISPDSQSRSIRYRFVKLFDIIQSVD